MIEIRRLEQDDRVEDFDCGEHALNDYLKRHAWANQRRNLVGVTQVAVDRGTRRVIGYYTLATAGIPRGALPALVTKDLPRYASLPAALLARLAVDRQFQGSGLGKKLLGHAFANIATLSRQIGCRYLIVDAYPSAVGWYAKYGFLALEGLSSVGTQPLLIDVRTLESAVLAMRERK